MRWIVLVLLLLNGGFFAWQYYGAHGKPAMDQSTDAKGEYDPLTLISELSDEQRKVLGVTPKDGEKAAEEGASKQAPMAEQEQATEQPAPSATAEAAKGMMAETETAAKAEPETKMQEAPEKPVAKAETAPIAPKPKEQQAADKPHCYALGPMGNQKLVNRVKGRVTSMGLTVDQIRNEVEKVPTNWIYLGPIKSAAEAKRTLQRLHSKGVKDTQLINKGANNYIISVGLFSTKQGADDRLKRLQDAGFTPNISQVTAKKSHYWLDVSYNGGKQVDKKILKDMVRGVSGAGVKEIACKPR
jgi:cell division protein FtsN